MTSPELCAASALCPFLKTITLQRVSLCSLSVPTLTLVRPDRCVQLTPLSRFKGFPLSTRPTTVAGMERRVMAPEPTLLIGDPLHFFHDIQRGEKVYSLSL